MRAHASFLLCLTLLMVVGPVFLHAQLEGAKVYLSTQQHYSRQLLLNNSFPPEDGLLNSGKDPYLRDSPFTLSVSPSIGMFVTNRLLLRCDFTAFIWRKSIEKRALLEVKPILRYYFKPQAAGLKLFLEGGGGYTTTNQELELEEVTGEISFGFTHLLNEGVLFDGLITYQSHDLNAKANLMLSTRIGFLLESGIGYERQVVSELQRGQYLLGMSHFRAGIYNSEPEQGSNMSFRPQLQYVLGKRLAIGGELFFDYFKHYRFTSEVFSNGGEFTSFYRRINLGFGPSVRTFINKNHRSLFFVEVAGRFERKQVHEHYRPFYQPQEIVLRNYIRDFIYLRLKSGLQHFLNEHAALEVAPAVTYDFSEEIYRLRLEFGFQVLVGG